MLLAVPATACGGPPPASVFDLEPLLVFARHCGPDAVSLMPPPGPDDLPNGAALLTIKGRLEQDGLRAIGGSWTVPADAPLADPAWQIESLFQARAVIGALGEAGVDPLIVDWQPSGGGAATDQAMLYYLERLLEEAERARVRLALRSSLAAEARLNLMLRLSSPWLGLCAGLAQLTGERMAREGDRLFVTAIESLRLDSGDAALLRVLGAGDFDGVSLLGDFADAAQYGWALGFCRGVLSAPA